MRPIRNVKVSLEAIGELRATISGLEIKLSVAREAETRLSAEVATLKEQLSAALASGSAAQPKQRYRLLEDGETVRPGDQKLLGDGITWVALTEMSYGVGGDYNGRVPCRRLISG